MVVGTAGFRCTHKASTLKLRSTSLRPPKGTVALMGQYYVMSGPGLDIWRCPEGRARWRRGVWQQLPWLRYDSLLQELGQVTEPEDPRHFRREGGGGAGC